MTQYKKFKIGASYVVRGHLIDNDPNGLFVIMPTKRRINAKDAKAKGPFNYVSRGTTNNGIASKIQYDSKYLNDGHTLSFAQDTAAIFYQDEPYFTGNKVNVFKLNDKYGNLTRDLALYLVGAIRSAFPDFKWGMMLNIEKIANTDIELPVTPAGEPDFEYMTMRIRGLEAERIRELEAYLRVTGLDDTMLSVSEAQALTQDVQWKKFRIGDVFDKKTVKGYPKKIEDLISVKDGYHTFGQNIHYQHSQRIKMPDKYLFKVTRPILAYASSTGSVGMINESFYRSGDNGAFQALLPKFNDERATTMLFILVIMKRVFAQFNYNTNVRGILDIDIELPVNSTGEIDFDYMQNYICAMEKQTIKGAVEYKDRVIEETKKVVNE